MESTADGWRCFRLRSARRLWRALLGGSGQQRALIGSLWQPIVVRLPGAPVTAPTTSMDPSAIDPNFGRNPSPSEAQRMLDSFWRKEIQTIQNMTHVICF